MSFPKVQTSLAHKLTRYVNKKYDTHLSIEKVDLSYAGQIKLKNILINDSRNDTVIFVKKLQTSLLNFNRIYKGKPDLGDVTIDEANVVMRTYKGEKEDGLHIFINKFDKKKTDDKPSGFLLTSEQIALENTRFALIDQNKDSIPIVAYKNINAKINDFKVSGPNIYGSIRNLSFIDQNGLVVDKMETDFTYTRSYMHYLNLKLETQTSTVAGEMRMNYKRSDLADFNNKVQIEASFENATVSLKDIRHFYNELGDQDIVHFSADMQGTLNDFVIKNLKLRSKQKSRINGKLHLINSFDKTKDFELIANITHLESDYNHLKSLLPNILGKTLPSSFKEFGHFSMSGFSHISTKEIDARLVTHSDIGKISSDLKISDIDIIDQAKYKGTVSVEDLKLGNLVGDPLIGEFSMEAEVEGKGFTLEHLDTQVKGIITKHQYKAYTYHNINIDGKVKDKLFSGNFTAKDPNLNMTFNGLADLSQERYKFNFKSHVKHANFNKLNLLKRDSIAILKGDIDMAMTGNRLENMQGYIKFNNATYTNQVQDYYFKDFNITSTIKDSVQTLSINSSDIVNGRIKGKFLFKELPKLAQNAFGSIYTNYRPFEVSPNQYLDFRFTIYNQVIAVFFPKVKLGTNTSIRGKINADRDIFKLTFKSPELMAYDNYIKKIRLQIDNKNPLFNTQLSVKNVESKYYDIAHFDLVNITLNDTLYFRSEFNGGKKLKDQYNLAFYHTINEQNQSVIGFQKSDITIKDIKWILNPNEDDKNKLVYDHTNNSIDYQDFLITSEGQQILFYGEQQGENYRNYNIDLDRVSLAKVTPDIENFDIKGLINGGIWIEKRNNMLIPMADIQLLDFYINGELQGDLIGEIKGAESNKVYQIDLSIEKDDQKNMLAKGKLDLHPKKPTIDLGITFDNYQIAMLNALGKGVMENIRGSVSGNARLDGTIENPDFSGKLFIDNAGMYFPFINIDYALENNTQILLNNQSFILKDAKVYDSLFETSGNLSGSISHKYFKKWYLDLEINTPNLLAINTPEEEDSLFYGTGYLNGIATFKGSTDNVNITINGNSNPGTEIIIPMSDVETIESSKLIQFKTPPSKENNSLKNLEKQLIERFKGVTMDFNLGITKDATIEIVIDKSTGSSLKGNGIGDIQMDIDTKGTFNMYGDFIVDKGIYNFKYGGIINKPFDVKRGGTISFNGDPYKANLDIEAVYTVKANPKVILPEFESNRNIPVELTTKITGELFDSKQEFDITIPNASLDMSSELDFVLNDQDTGNMMRQFVSLLAIGNFFNESNLNYTSAIGNEGISSAAMAISNALLDIFSDPDDKIQFGFDYTQGNSGNNNILESTNQLGVSVATRLGKNEKILINGEVNVPTGSQSNANIAGNVSVELPLNKKETVRMKVFNRQNEIQYTDEEEGYTQGMGISWQVDFDNWKELKEKIGLKKETEKKEKTKQVQDSIPKKNFILFN
jgi:hypothetical protein